ALGDLPAALADYGEAVRLDPGYPDAFLNRALAHAALGNEEQALVDNIEAIRLAPKRAASFEGFVKVWAAAGDPRMAVEAARRACDLSGWSDWTALRALA